MTEVESKHFRLECLRIAERLPHVNSVEEILVEAEKLHTWIEGGATGLVAFCEGKKDQC